MLGNDGCPSFPNMKYLMYFVIVLFFVSLRPCSAYPSDLAAKKPVEIAVYKLLYARHGQLGGLEGWRAEARVNYGISDNDIREELIAYVRGELDKSDRGFLAEVKKYDTSVSRRAARFAMKLYPGDSHVEDAVREAWRYADKNDTQDVSFSWLDVIGSEASDELISECIVSLDDPKKINFLNKTASRRGKFHRASANIKHDNEANGISMGNMTINAYGINKVGWLGVGFVGLLLVAYGVVGRKRACWIIGIVAVLISIGGLCLCAGEKVLPSDLTINKRLSVRFAEGIGRAS